MEHIDLRELYREDCYKQLLQAYLELYFDTHDGKKVIELYDCDGCGLLVPTFNVVYRQFIYKVINMFNYEVVDKFVKEKHEEFERKRIERNCEDEEGENND